MTSVEIRDLLDGMSKNVMSERNWPTLDEGRILSIHIKHVHDLYIL